MGKLAYTNKYVYGFLNAFLRAQPVHHHNFDWYSAPIAFHYTEEEIVEWFNSCNLTEIRGDNPVTNPSSYYTRLYPKFTLTKEGTLKGWVNKIYPRWGLTLKGKKV